MAFGKCVLHLFAGILFAVAYYVDRTIPLNVQGLSYRAAYGGRWKFLTVWNHVFQLTYFVSAFLMDVVTLIKGREVKWMTTLKDILYAAVVFPFGVFVAATFWGIYFVDRELIFPKALDEIFPSWLNHALHTWCAIFAITEGAFVRHRYPSNRVGLSILLGIALVYLSWVCWIAYAAKIWVYPFLRIMSNPARGVFFAICALILLFFYWMGKWMNRVIWGGSEAPVEVSKSASPAKKKAKKAD